MGWVSSKLSYPRIQPLVFLSECLQTPIGWFVHLSSELQFLKNTCHHNGYSCTVIKSAFEAYERSQWVRPSSVEEETFKGTVVVPFCATVTNRLTRFLRRKGLRVVSWPLHKIKQLLSSLQDPRGRNVPGVYQIPCEFGEAYVGQTGQSAEVRRQEHQWHLRLGHTDLSAITQHGWDKGHSILFHETKIPHCSSS